MVTKFRLPRKCPDERRDHILAVAAAAFAKGGYGATSMSTIAAMLGGSKATLYKYFPSKEALLEAVVQARCARVLVPLREMRGDGDGDLESLLTRFGEMFLAKIYDLEALDVHRLVHAEGARFPELAEIFFRSGPDAVMHELRETLRRFVQGGTIDCPDIALAAGQYIGMLRGDRHLRFAIGLAPAADADELRQHAAHAARIFVRGLLPRST